MKHSFSNMPVLSIMVFVALGFFSPTVGAIEITPSDAKPVYSGYYSREGNNAKMAQTSGNNQYVRLYPKERIIRLYIPYPYSKTVTPNAINKAFDEAKKRTSGSAYIKDKFGIMNEKVVAHLDFYRWVDEQVMFDCGKPKPCKVQFGNNSMTVIKPGIVLEHKIQYELVPDK